jgi:hypothetical protein
MSEAVYWGVHDQVRGVQGMVSRQMCKGNAGRSRSHGRLCLLGVSEASPGGGIVQTGSVEGKWEGHVGSLDRALT